MSTEKLAKGAKDEKEYIAVEWIDASYYDYPVSVTSELSPIMLCSVGHLVKDMEDYICVALEKSPTEEKFRYVTCIPKSLIKKIVKLNVPPPAVLLS